MGIIMPSETQRFATRPLSHFDIAQLNEIDAAIKHLTQARKLGSSDTDSILGDVILTLEWVKENIEEGW